MPADADCSDCVALGAGFDKSGLRNVCMCRVWLLQGFREYHSRLKGPERGAFQTSDLGDVSVCEMLDLNPKPCNNCLDPQTNCCGVSRPS